MAKMITCPHCGRRHAVNPGKVLSAYRSPAVSKANGAKGGRPKGAKDIEPRTRRTKEELEAL